MQLILLTGLPGTGKSTLAEKLSQKIKVPLFSKDNIEAALQRCDVNTVLSGNQPVSFAVYEILFTLVQQQLLLGQSCIIDCVAGHINVRERFKSIAHETNAKWIVIECVCSDEDMHKVRLLTRKRNIPGYHELNWHQLLETKRHYAPWQEEHKIINSTNQLECNIAMALSYIESKGGKGL